MPLNEQNTLPLSSSPQLLDLETAKTLKPKQLFSSSEEMTQQYPMARTNDNGPGPSMQMMTKPVQVLAPPETQRFFWPAADDPQRLRSLTELSKQMSNSPQGNRGIQSMLARRHSQSRQGQAVKSQTNTPNRNVMPKQHYTPQLK